jgi:hypothetical protein
MIGVASIIMRRNAPGWNKCLAAMFELPPISRFICVLWEKSREAIELRCEILITPQSSTCGGEKLHLYRFCDQEAREYRKMLRMIVLDSMTLDHKIA